MDLRSYARSFTELSVQTLAGIVSNGDTDAARVTACIHLLDRGWGKCEQVHSGNVDQDIRITIRQLVEPQPKVIDEKPKIISERKRDQTR